MPDRSSPAQAGPEQPANISITNRREPNSPRLISRLKPAPTYLLRAMQTLTPDPFCPLTDPQPYQRDGAEPPLAAASLANIENCFIKLNLDLTAASGWLQRLVRCFAHATARRLKSTSRCVGLCVRWRSARVR